MNDKKRLNKLKDIYIKNSNLDKENLDLILEYINIFEKIISTEEIYDDSIKNNNEELNKLFLIAKKYVQHYYISMNMAIDRGEISEKVAEFYNLKFPFEPPQINTFEQLINIADELFLLDDKRIENGGKHFTNPTISTVKVWVEKFKEKYNEQNITKNQNKIHIENIDAYRTNADKIINLYSPSKSEKSKQNIDKSKNNHDSQLSFDFE